MQQLLELERKGWQALSTPAGAGRRFYASVLREDAIMLFPGGLVIVGKEAILESITDHPWEGFDMRDPRLIRLSDHAAVVVYGVVARRGDVAPYSALISSTYARAEGAWRLVLHQQTPS